MLRFCVAAPTTFRVEGIPQDRDSAFRTAADEIATTRYDVFAKQYPDVKVDVHSGQDDEKLTKAVLETFDARPGMLIQELDRQLNLNESVLRTKVLRTDKH